MTDLNSTTALTAPTVKIEMSFVPHLATGETVMPIAAYVTPVGFDALAKGPSNAFVGFGDDISGSMHNYIDEKKPAAGLKDDLMRSGTIAGLDALLPTMTFAIYTIGHGGARVFGPALATPDNIKKAKAAVAAMNANQGSTDMTPCLRMFREDAEVLRKEKGITTAVLGVLTDGGFSDSALVNRELGLDASTDPRIQNYRTARASGLSLTIVPFGIGLDWQPKQLQLLADATVSPEAPSLVLSAAQVKETFERVVELGASQALSNVKLCLKKAATVPLKSASVQKPTSVDLTDKVVVVDDKNCYIPLGFWNNETRLVYVELGVTPTEGNLTACFLWFEYDIGGKTVKTEQQKVTCTWTSDEGLSSRIARGVDEGNLVEASKRRLRQAGQLAGTGDFEKADALLSSQYQAAKAKKAAGVDVQAVFDMILAQADVVDEEKGIVRMRDRSQAGAMKMEAESGQSKVRKRGAI